MYLLVNLIVLLVLQSTTATSNGNGTGTETSTQATKVTTKTKRTIGDLHTYGENKPILLLVDNVASPSSNIPSFYTNPKALVLKPVFEPEIPKQVAAQQVLYEFQQTPTNAVSNVHVNQLFQPFDFTKDGPTGPQAFSTEQPPTRQSYTRGNIPPTGPGQTIQTSESIANPVQHTALINHGQNYAHVQFQPSIPTVGTPQHIQTHHYIPGKYLYVNGKIIYQPAPVAQSSNNAQSPGPFNGVQNLQGQQNFHPQGHLHPQGHHPQSFNQNSLGNTAPQTYGHHGNPNHIQHINKRPPVNYITFHNNPRLPKQNLTPPPKPSAPPMHYSNSKFQPPSRLQQITKPMSSPAPVAEREEEESEEDEKAAVKEEEEEVEEDDEEESPRSRYKEEEDDDEERYYEERPGRYYERYRYNDDDEEEEDDHPRYRKEQEEAEEEEDEDSHEGSSKVVPTKVKKHSRGRSGSKRHGRPHDKNKNYKYSESYGSKTEYETPGKHSKKGKSKTRSKPGYYKTVKYTKQANGKPKIETIEGRQSQLVPVIEKRKVFQESWVVSKSTDAGSA